MSYSDPAPDVLILLASRNGAAWLEPQLASIAAQDHGAWALWVSDDGSTDGTRQIVERFAAEQAGRHAVTLVEGPRLGSAGANFLTLLCRDDLPLGPRTHVAFADQDDIWYPQKLSRALEVLAGAKGPALYGAQSRHVDAAGVPTGGRSRRPAEGRAPLSGQPQINQAQPDQPQTGQSPLILPEIILPQTSLPQVDLSETCHAAPPLGNLLVQNLVSGHSAVLNPAGAALARAFGVPAGAAFHDWWLAQAVAAAGGEIRIDRAVMLDYRQHGHNTLGGPLGTAALAHRAGLLRRRAYAGWIRAHLEALQAGPVTPEARALLERLQSLPAAGPQRLNGFRKLGLHRQSRAGTAALLLSAFAGLA